MPDNPWPGLWAMVLGFFMILVDSTIVSVATPALMDHFGAGINEVLWVTSAYLLAYAVPLLITGRLGDRVGPKRVYLAGLAVFTLASLACGLTGTVDSTITALIIARVVQGLGASMMTPQTMTVITRTFPAHRRGSAMALWGATAGVATLIGPLLGGLLIDGIGWEWIFYVNVPIGVIALILAARYVPVMETRSHAFDWVGVALSAAGLFLGVFGIQEGAAYDWGTIAGPISVPLLLTLAAALLIAFVWWQSRVRTEPLVPLSLFRDRNFTLANIGITAVGFSVTAMVFPFTIYAQTVRGLSPTGAALLLAPQAIMGLLLARPVGKLVDRTHPRTLAGVGILGWAISLFLLSRLMTPGSATWQILAVAVLLGASSSLVWGPLSTSASRNLPPHLAGAGSGVYNTTRQMGSVLGSAAIASFMAARMSAHLPGAADAQARMGGGTIPAAIAEPFSAALAESLLLPAGVLLIGWVAALCLETPRHLRND